MAGVFLTEGHRLSPRHSVKPKQAHPWRTTPAVGRGPHVYNPAHITGADDEEVLPRDMMMAPGCYVKRPYT